MRGAKILRFHPRCYYRPGDDAPTEIWPAMIAAVTDLGGDITGARRLARSRTTLQDLKKFEDCHAVRQIFVVDRDAIVGEAPRWRGIVEPLVADWIGVAALTR